MTPDYVQKLAGKDGRTATLRYRLSKERGWDVRAELDDRLVAIRHCVEWHGVERLRDWLRRQV